MTLDQTALHLVQLSSSIKFTRANSISFTLSNLGEFFWSWILKDYILRLGKEKESRPCDHVLLKTWDEEFSRRSRGVTAKKRTEKASNGNEDVNEHTVLRKGIRHTHFNELFVPN